MAPERGIEELLPENTLKTRVPQEQVERVTRPAPTDEELMEVASLLVDIVHDSSL